SASISTGKGAQQQEIATKSKVTTGMVVEWEAQIDIVDTETDITVEVHDSSNNSTLDTDIARVKKVLLPLEFNLDRDNNRIVGIAYDELWTPIIVDFNF